MVNKAKADIEHKWEVTNLGKPAKIVGIEISQSLEVITCNTSWDVL